MEQFEILNLSQATINWLNYNKIQNIEQIYEIGDLGEFYKLKRVGMSRTVEICKCLSEKGYPLKKWMPIEAAMVREKTIELLKQQGIRMVKDLNDMTSYKLKRLLKYDEDLYDELVEVLEGNELFLKDRNYCHQHKRNRDKILICGSDKVVEIRDYEGYIDLIMAVKGDSTIKIPKCMYSGVVKKRLENILETLTEIEKNILVTRYGILDNEFKTLEQVGCIYNLTKERIRQIEKNALRKLRFPSRYRPLTNIECKSWINKKDDNVFWIERKFQEEFRDYITHFKYRSHEWLMFIPRVLLFNKLNIEIIKQEDIELSTDALKVIKSISENELRIRNIGRKTLEKTIEEIEGYKSKYYEVKVSINEKEKIYQYKANNLEEVANDLYVEIFGNEENKLSIFDSGLPSRIINGLLLDGWIFIKDVCTNSESIIKKLENSGCQFEANQLKEYIETSQMITDIGEGEILLVRTSEDFAEILIKEKIDTMDKLTEMVCDNKWKKYHELIKDIVKNYTVEGV